MSHRYNAFLIRHWSLDADQGTRIEITHVATGRSTLVTSLPVALAWMQEVVADESSPTRSQNGRERGGGAGSATLIEH